MSTPRVLKVSSVQWAVGTPRHGYYSRGPQYACLHRLCSGITRLPRQLSKFTTSPPPDVLGEAVSGGYCRACVEHWYEIRSQSVR